MYFSNVILSLLSLFGSVNPLNVTSTSMGKYTDFLNEYHKEYNLENFKIFTDNLKLIEDHNQENSSYKLGINQFTDMKPSNNDNISFEYKEGFYNDFDDIVPESVDWRQKNAVTDVKNQGRCGSCWAFSSTGSIEGVVSIKTGTLFNISEQQLMDCSHSYGNNGCEGGAMDNAFKYVIDNGICTEQDYPYEGTDDICQQCKSVVSINDYMDIRSNNERILKRAVAQQPVSVAIQANITSFQLYLSGVYSDPNCGTKLDHGVLIVGYGHDDDSNLDYWIVKNSWGTRWGEQGYMRMERNSDRLHGMCGIAMIPSIPLLGDKSIQ